MPKVNRRRSHSHHVNYRRSIESIASNETETISIEEEEVPINPNTYIDHIDFLDEFALNNIRDLLSFCKEQVNTGFISVPMYMSLRRLGHSWRDVESFLTPIGGMTIKTCHK